MTNLFVDTICDVEEDEVQLSESVNSAKNITVSMACITETMKTLRIHRIEREKIVRILIDSVALVMKAVNVTDESISNGEVENLSSSCSTSRDSDECSSSAKTSKTSGKYELTTPVESKDMNESKTGSPFRVQLTGLGSHQIHQKSLAAIKSEEDLRMQFWQVLPESPQVILRKQDPGSASPGSPTRQNSLSAAVSKGLNELELSKSQGQVQGLGQVEDICEEKQMSSSWLRENMETDRANLNLIQRGIRTLSENGQLDKIEGMVVARTEVAIRSLSTAADLYEHIHTVRIMQNSRQRLLSSTLSLLEEMMSRWKTTMDLEPSIPDLGPLIPELGSSIPEVALNTEVIPIVTLDVNSEQCSWSEWEGIARMCSEVVSAVDSSPTESATFALKDALQAQSKIASQISDWLSKSDDINDFADPGSVTVSQSGFCAHSNSKSAAIMLCTDAMLSESSETEGDTLANKHQSNLTALDRARMALKCAADVEVAAMINQSTEILKTVNITFRKGAGLLKNLISQNRLDIMEVVAMEVEMNDWLSVLNYLKDPIEVRTFSSSDSSQFLFLQDSSAKARIFID